MKTIHQFATCVALVALTGCEPSSPPTGEKPPETPASTGAVLELPKNTPAVTLNKEPAAVPSPVPAAAPVAEDKTSFITSTEQKLKDFDAKIDELAKTSAEYKDDAKAQADQALAALREQRAKLNEQFDSLRQSSAEAWKEIKAGFESALNELEKAYENAKAKFS